MMIKEDGLFSKMNRSVERKIGPNAVEITSEFKNEYKQLIATMRNFFENMNEEFDISKLKIYEENIFIFQNGPLGRLLALYTNDTILLSKRLKTKSDYVKKFVIIHELLHFLVKNDSPEINKKIHQRSGYDLRHLDYDSVEDDIIANKVFFTYFNEGVTDWITILILGEEFTQFFKQNEDHLKLYNLAKGLIKDVEDYFSEKEIIKDYINRGSKFLQAIHKKHGKYSIMILSQLNKDNFDDSIEFFQTNDLKRKEELRNKLRINSKTSK